MWSLRYLRKGETCVKFPDPRAANSDGLIAFGGDLSTETLQLAYSMGIFPWPQPGLPLLWFSPDPRGVVEFEDLHLPHSFEKWRRKNKHLTTTVNQDFSAVIEGCAKAPRQGQKGTWILPSIVDAYVDLHKKGLATSVEIREEGELIGGIYGVNVAGYFSAESMYGLKTNISKLALVELVAYLSQMNKTWMDIQMLTNVTMSFGGKFITREDFLLRIGFLQGDQQKGKARK